MMALQRLYKTICTTIAGAAITLYCAGCTSSYERNIKYWDEETVVEAQTPSATLDSKVEEDEEQKRKAAESAK